MNIDELPHALRFDGGPGFDVSAQLGKIAGDFTIEAWVRLDPPERGVTAFDEAQFGGPGVVLPAGRYDDLAQRLPAGQITIYAEKNRGGEQWTFDAGDEVNLAGKGVTSVGSVDVPAWLKADFFARPDRKGPVQTVEEDMADATSLNKPASLRVHRSIESLRVPEGWEAVLFENPGCEGRARRLTASTQSLATEPGASWSLNQAKSMAVLDTRHRRQDLAVIFENADFTDGHAWCFSLGGHARPGRVRSIRFVPYYPDTHPGADQFTFFDQPGQQGNSFLWNTTDRGNTIMDTDKDIPLASLASVKLGCSASMVTVYSEPGVRDYINGAGANRTIGEGDIGLLSINAGSLLLPPGLRATLYPEPDFKGAPMVCEGPVLDLNNDAGFAFCSLMISRTPPPDDTTHVGAFLGQVFTNPAPRFCIGAFLNSESYPLLHSLVVPEKLRLTLFGKGDWTGETLEIDGSRSHFTLRNTGPWYSAAVSQVCGTRPTAARVALRNTQTPALLDNVWHLPVGRFADLAMFNAMDATQQQAAPVDRLDLQPGCGARLYPQADCAGAPAVCQSKNDLNLAGIASFEIFRYGSIFGNGSTGMTVIGEPPSSDVAPPRPTFSGAKLVRDMWHHLAITRAGAVWTWFLDGKQIAQANGDAGDIAGPLKIGETFTGLIGAVIVSKGAKDAKTLAGGRYHVPADGSDSALLAAWMVDTSTQVPGGMVERKTGAAIPLQTGTPIARTRFPRSVHLTSLAKGVAARTEDHGHDKLQDARAAAAVRKRKAEMKALTFLQDAHNAAAARAAAAPLDVMWRVENGQVADTGIGVRKADTPTLPAPGAGREVTALAADLVRKTLYTAGRDPSGTTFDITGLAGVTTTAITHAGATVHALVFEPQRRELWWIEHPGKLRRCSGKPGSTPVDVTTVPAVADDLWSLCIEDLDLTTPVTVKKTRIYWSNGREIWRAGIDISNGTLTSPALYVSHGVSLRPVALAVDDTFDETAGPHRGKLFWVDRDLGMVRSIAGSGHVHSLYSAPCPREALALDVMLQRLYWNAEHRQSVETAVIEQPGLFYWFEDRGEQSARHEHIDVLEDAREFRVEFDADGTLEAQAQSGWAKMPDAKPRHSLVFTADGAAATDPAKNSWIGIGPLFLDCTHGFSAEAVVRFDKNTANARLFDLGNGAANLNILLALDGTGTSLLFKVFNQGLASGYQLTATFPADGKWHHVIATIDANGNGTLTVDNKQLASGKMAVPAAGTRLTNFIGRGNGAPDAFFTGRIAMLRLWNRCLDADSISASWQNPFLELTEPDNPFGVFDKHLVRYERSLVEHRDGRVWLMSGVPDASWPAVPLMEMASDSSLIPLSSALADHQALIQAHYDRALAQAKHDADIAAANKAASDTVAKASADAAATKRKAHDHLATAKADADTRRRDAHKRQQAETEKQQQRLAAQKQASKTSKAKAETDAASTEQQARDRKAARVDAANRRLAAAHSERAKH